MSFEVLFGVWATVVVLGFFSIPAIDAYHKARHGKELAADDKGALAFAFCVWPISAVVLLWICGSGLLARVGTALGNRAKARFELAQERAHAQMELAQERTRLLKEATAEIEATIG